VKNFKSIFLTPVAVWQIIFPVLTALAVWLVFYPGLLYVDSLAQYKQALDGDFNSWHPPLMAVVLFLVNKLGANIGALMFVQCAALVLGLTALSRMLLDNLLPEAKIKPSAAFVVTLLFLTPLSPFLFHSITFGKDSWLILFLLWIIAYLLWLNKALQINFRAFALHVSAISLLTAALPLIRHNAFLILPVVGASLALIILKFYREQSNTGKTRWLFAALVVCLPVVLFLFMHLAVKNIFQVKNLYAEDYVKATELAKFIRKHPDLKDSYPLTAAHESSPVMVLNESYLDEFDNSKIYFWADAAPSEDCLQYTSCTNPLGSCELILDLPENSALPCFRRADVKSEALDEEYWRAVKDYPVSMATIKLNQARYMLYPDPQAETFHSTISANKFGLSLNESFAGIRDALTSVYRETNKSLYLLLSHLVWLVAGLTFFAAFLAKSIKRSPPDALFYLSLLFIPLVYYSSFAVAATNAEYRFMYPATFLVQLLASVFIIAKIKKISIE
jgi:hypothetical protein